LPFLLVFKTITDSEGYGIAQEHGLKHTEEWEANAKLISQAPKLHHWVTKRIEWLLSLPFKTQRESDELKELQAIDQATK